MDLQKLHSRYAAVPRVAIIALDRRYLNYGDFPGILDVREYSYRQHFRFRNIRGNANLKPRAILPLLKAVLSFAVRNRFVAPALEAN
jgi:hypothetical protein